MNYTYYKKVLQNFSKAEIIEYLGEKIFASLIEWTNTEDSLTKTSLIDILTSIYNYDLFYNQKFRLNFFQTMDFNDLKEISSTYDKSHKELAKLLADKDFTNNEFSIKLLEKFDSRDYTFEITHSENRVESVKQVDEQFFELLDYQYLIKQQTVYELTNRKSAIGRKILIHMPTGTGKTKTTMHIVAHFINFVLKGKGLIVWVAHTNELLQQALETFKSVWKHLGLFAWSVEKSWGKGEEHLTDGILFITIQALQKMRKSQNLEKYKRTVDSCELLIYDECHKIGATETYLVIKDFVQPIISRKTHFLGLTATPGRTTSTSIENRVFNEFFERKIEINVELIAQINMGAIEAINSNPSKDIIRYFQDRKILSMITKEELKYNIDSEILERLKKEFNSNSEKYTDDLINKIAINKSRNSVILCRLIALNKEQKPTIVFACSVLHAQMLSAFLNIENIPNALVYGEMSMAVRKQAIDDFKNKDSPVKIIINCDILTTGFDYPKIECVFITRPTKSVILYSQMIGRGLRGPQMGGTENCLLIDMKENLEMFNENESFSHFNNYWRN